MQEARCKRQEARCKMQNAKCKRQEARGKSISYFYFVYLYLCRNNFIWSFKYSFV